MPAPESASPAQTTGRMVVALFETRAAAEPALRDLLAAGFHRDQLGIAVRHEEGAPQVTDTTEGEPAEGAAPGVVTGGLAGGLLGLLIGVGAITIPGLGPVIAIGWLGGLLGGGAVGAAAGGLIGALARMGMAEEEARRYQDGVRAGGVLVTVEAGARVAQAVAILERHEASLGPTVPGGGRTASGMPAGKSAPEMIPEDARKTHPAGIVNLAAVEGYGPEGRERRRVADPLFAGPDRRGPPH